MTRRAFMLLTLAALSAAGASGYWIGRHGLTMPAMLSADQATPSPARAASGPVIYYQDPDGKPFYSLEPKQMPDGRAWRAVLASEDVSFDGQVLATSQPAGRRILYYRNPMGLADISQTPKKDSMGMAYIPVYEGDDDDGSSIKISPGKLQRIGVK